MATLKRITALPPPPPPMTYILELSAEEICGLRILLGSGTTASTLNTLGLWSVHKALYNDHELQIHTRRFARAASLDE
jgi:hypothetical protein